MAITILIIQTAYTAFFGWAAFAKLSRQPHMVDEFEKFGLPYWMALCAALAEVAVVTCLITGYFVPLFLFLGFALLVPVMIGAAAINFAKRPAQFGWGVIIVFLLPAATMAWLTRDGITALIP